MKNWFEFLFRPIPKRENKPLLRPLRYGILSLYALTMFIVVASIARTSWTDYQRTLHDIETQTLSQARLLDEHTTRSLISVEQAMQNIAEDIERGGGIDQLDERTLHQRLKDKIQLTPQIRGIIAIDGKGILRAHGLEFPTRQVNLSDRDYFSTHRKQTDKTFRIGIPVVSRTDNKWLIPVTRRLDNQTGSFDGVMLAGVEPNYYLRFYDSLKFSSGTRIQFLLKDGNVLLTYPLETDSIGRNLLNIDPQVGKQIPLTQSGFMQTRDKQGRDIFLTQLVNQTQLPLVIRISIDRDKVLTQYWRETTSKVASAVVLMLVLSVMLYLLMRQIRRVEASESRLYLTQFTVDESPDMILWCDQTGKVHYANYSLVEVSGYNMREICTLKYSDLIANSKTVLENLRRHIWEIRQIQPDRQGHSRLPDLPQQQKMETHLLTHTGQRIPVEINLSLIDFNEDTYICISARDISARQEAERELRHHRDHLQELVAERTAEISAVLDASPLAVMLSMRNRIKLVNPAFENLFGYSAKEVIGREETLIHDSQQSYREIHDSISSFTQAGATYRGEIELRRRDGSIFWGMLFAKAIEQQAPERGMVQIIEDITAQRIAAQAIRQSERLRRNIINTTSDGFVLIDAERNLVDVNSAFCKILGLKREKLLGHRSEIVLGELAEKLFPTQIDSTRKQAGEIELIAGNGSRRPFLVNAGIIPDDNGRPEYAFAFLTDISQQKDVEKTLFEAKETAEAANKAKTVFLANMSHELRTPMHAILSFSEMGLQKGGLGEAEQLVRYFERINTSGKRLLTLLNDLLDMSRLDANKMTYDKARHILQTTTRNAANEISSLLSGKQLTLTINDNQQKLLAVYDKARITQVLVNLLSNAIKFSPQGGQIQIDFITDAQLDHHMPAIGLTVRDQGPGIPEADLERIFDTFAQSHLEQGTGGTGLGLAISRQIMRDHQGNISARNHPDGGAIFTLLLPNETEKPQTEVG